MPKLIDIDEFCKDLPEITTQKLMRKRKFRENGLFSEFIFGPIKNYTCDCGIYHGVSRDGGECDKCGMKITNSDERRKRFAKIVLPVPVINPIFYDLFIRISKNKTKIKNMIDELTTNNQSVLYVDSNTDEFVVVNKCDMPPDVEYYEALNAMQFLFETYTKQSMEDDPESWKIVYDNLDKIFIQNIIVLPPELRPASRGINKDNRVADEINKYYLTLINRNLSLSGTKFELIQNKVIFYDYFSQTQKDVNELYDYILKKLKKKEGLIRGHILAKRIDFSGRCVITPNIRIKLHQCVLPYKMVLELFKIQIAKRLIELGTFKLFPKAIKQVEYCIETRDPALFKLCCKLTKDEYCILNRQPTLHRLGMIGFQILVSMEDVIQIHPLVCEGFNADFDGDAMAIYIPISKEAKQEIKDKLLSTKNLVNPSNGSLSTIPSQDIVYGIYLLSKGLVEADDLNNTMEWEGKEIIKGRIVVNYCFPDDYPFINKVITKKVLVDILTDIRKKYPEEIVAEVFNKVKFVGFKYSTLYGVTMSLFNCAIPNVEKIKDEIYKDENIHNQLVKINSDEIKEYLRENFKYAGIIDSGARGSWDQVRQMVFSRGFISNFDGQILSNPIKNSLIHGLTPKEFFNSTYGCRKGLLDIALHAGVSGYLSRKLIYCCVNLTLGTQDDCGTTDLLRVEVTSIKKAEMLIGKYFKENLEDKRLKKFSHKSIEKYLDKTIYVRSPIYCKNPTICKKCYGDFYKNLNSEYIGVIAAQSLGEANTQLVLRTFHTSGVAQIKKSEDNETENNDFIQQDIVADLTSASNKLHKFPRNTTAEVLVDDLFEIYNSSKKINHVHFECVVSQLMWYKNNKWRLIKDREMVTPEFYSVQKVPSLESWLLGFAFSNPKKHLLDGIINTNSSYSGIMNRVMMGEKFNINLKQGE